MLSSILTSFQGFFSRSFWFSSFLPVALFAALHFTIAGLAFPTQVPLLALISKLAQDVVLLPLIVIGLAVLAYALRPFIPLFRGVLDGTLLPTWLHSQLRQPRLEERKKADAGYEKARDNFEDWQLFQLGQEDTLREERAKGDMLAEIDDRNAIAEAKRQIAEWSTSIETGELDRTKAKAACDALATALEKNACSLPGQPAPGQTAPTPADKQDALTLNAAHAAMVTLLLTAVKEAEYEFERIRGLTRTALHNTPPSATRAGDARQRVESYCKNVYDAKFEYLWPRLQSVIEKDGDKVFAERLTDSQSQIDFAVLSLVLSLSVGLVWLPILASTALSPLLFLVVGLLNPLVSVFLYALVVNSQSVFGEIVQTAIDRHRLAVLSALHFRLPPTLVAEREMWSRLGKLEEAGGKLDVTFEHPATK